MADIFSGYKRSLKCFVSKKLNGVVDVGYPKQYPTATDILNGYFTYNSVQYDIPTSEELSTMSQSAYDSLLATFKLYVEAAEAGASFATDTIVAPTIYDPSGCAVEPPTTTTTSTTSTTTTTEVTPDMSYEIVPDGDGYISTQTIFNISGAIVGDIVTIEMAYSGALELDVGFSSTMARMFAYYPNGTTQALSNCFSDSANHIYSFTKTFSFLVYDSIFNITTEAYMINTTNYPISGEFSLTITNVNRNGIDYTMNKKALGKHYYTIQPQFSC